MNEKMLNVTRSRHGEVLRGWATHQKKTTKKQTLDGGRKKRIIGNQPKKRISRKPGA